MAVPNILTVIDTIGSGSSTIRVSLTSSENISDRLTIAVIRVFARYMTAGPTIIRTALRSLVARDIRSPVRFSWKNEIGSRSRCAKKSLRRSYSTPRDALMMMRRI